MKKIVLKTGDLSNSVDELRFEFFKNYDQMTIISYSGHIEKINLSKFPKVKNDDLILVHDYIGDFCFLSRIAGDPFINLDYGRCVYEVWLDIVYGASAIWTGKFWELTDSCHSIGADMNKWDDKKLRWVPNKKFKGPSGCDVLNTCLSILVDNEEMDGVNLEKAFFSIKNKPNISKLLKENARKKNSSKR